MRRILGLRPSPSMAVALVALGIALGGTAYAASLPVNSVGTAQIRPGAVTTPDIRARAVTNGKLAARAVTTGKIGTFAVTNGKIAIGAVTEGRLATGAVSGRRLQNGAVGNSKLTSGAVTGSKIAGGTIGSGNLASNSVSGSKLSSGAVSNGKLGSSSVTGSKIAARSVGADDLNVITMREASVEVANAGGAGDGSYPTRSVSRQCSSNERAISAGARWDTNDNDDELPVISMRYLLNGANQPTGVEARGGNDTANNRTFTVQVLCLRN